MWLWVAIFWASMAAIVYFCDRLDIKLKKEGEGRLRLLFFMQDLRTLRGRWVCRLLSFYFKINGWKLV